MEQNAIDRKKTEEMLDSINFGQIIDFGEDYYADGKAFERYREASFRHPEPIGFCTACEDTQPPCNVGGKNKEFKLGCISHGAMSRDFDKYYQNFREDECKNIYIKLGMSKIDTPIMFVYENPSNNYFISAEINKNNKDYGCCEKSLIKYEKYPTRRWWKLEDMDEKGKNNKIAGEYQRDYVSFLRKKQYGAQLRAICRVFGLDNIYTTNLVKCGIGKAPTDSEEQKAGKISDYPKGCIDLCVKTILLKELNVFQPKIIFAFSRNVENYLRKYCKEHGPELRNIPASCNKGEDGQPPAIYYLPHPACRMCNNERKKKIVDVVGQASVKASKLSADELEDIKRLING